MFHKFNNDIGYTGEGDKQSKRETFITEELPRRVAQIENRILYPPRKIEDGTNPLEGEVMKIIIPSNITDKYTRLEVLLGLKLSGHTDIVTEASNVLVKLYKQSDIQNEQQNQNALDNALDKVIAFFSFKWNYLVNF